MRRVDQRNGTEESPFKTIQEAINAAPTASMSIQVYIKSGTYTENLSLYGFRNIALRKYTGATVMVQSISAAYCEKVFIFGININSASTPHYAGIHF